MSRVLILNGSYMPGGSIDTLVSELKRGVEDAGNECVRLDVTRMNINGCRGCNGCKNGKGDPCIQKDDMRRVFDELGKANAVVLATPLYFYQMTGALKVVIDRMYALSEMETGIGSVAMVAACADSAEAMEASLIPYYELCFEGVFGWEDRGRVLASGVVNGADARRSPAFAEAYELGKSLRRLPA